MENSDYILKTIQELERFAQENKLSKLLTRARKAREMYCRDVKESKGK